MRTRVFVAALGHPYGPNAERGVFRSRDGGATWQRVLGNDDATGAIDLAFEPGNPRRDLRGDVADAAHAVEHLSAGERARQRPVQIHRRRRHLDADAAATAFPDKVGRIGIAVATSDPKRVYAIVDSLAMATTSAACIAPTMPARTGSTSASDDRIWQRGWYFGRITVDPKNADRVYVDEHDRAALGRRRRAFHRAEGRRDRR